MNNTSISLLKEQIVSITLSKIGLSVDKLYKMSSDEILRMVSNLNDRRVHDFIVHYSYPSGSFGYLSYTGTYDNAKKYALEFVAKEYGIYDSRIEDSYVTREYPIYTISTKDICVEVIPRASYIAYYNEK